MPIQLMSLSWKRSGNVEWYSQLFANLICQDRILCPQFSKGICLYPDPTIYSFIYFFIQQIFFENLQMLCTNFGTRNTAVNKTNKILVLWALHSSKWNRWQIFKQGSNLRLWQVLLRKQVSLKLLVLRMSKMHVLFVPFLPFQLYHFQSPFISMLISKCLCHDMV